MNSVTVHPILQLNSNAICKTTKKMSMVFTSFQPHSPILISHLSFQHIPKEPFLPILTKPQTPLIIPSLKCHNQNHQTTAQEEGIPLEDVTILARFKSRHNYIRVLEVSRKAQHPFAGSRLLLLDSPGNIHSISFHFKLLTNTYFDVFATLPPILPPGPIAILGFGAGSAARIILELFPHVTIHAWEIDPSVIDVARKFFSLGKLEKEHEDRLFINVGNDLHASRKDGFGGVLVDLFGGGCLLPELQSTRFWERLRKGLRKGGRVMVNVGGRCVEAEDKMRDGEVVMEETLKAMERVFGDRLYVLGLGDRKEDSCIALTGDFPNTEVWKNGLPRSLRDYVDMWKPYSG